MLYKHFKNHVSFQRISALAVLALLVIVSLQNPLGAQAVTRAYVSERSLQRGMLVQLKEGDATKIEAVPQKAVDKFHGVVVDANDAPLTISGEGNKTYVATANSYQALVSDQNGPIVAGDYITVSALDGVGMKVGTTEPYIVGRAITAFDGKTGAISTAKVKDSNGAEKSVNIARVQMDIGMGRNPFVKPTESKMPEFLRKTAEAIAGKPVNAVRVYMGLFVLLVTSIIASTLLYGAVRSAVIAVGRNPLSKRSIIRSMFQVVLVSIIIFITGLFGVYLLLRV